MADCKTAVFLLSLTFMQRFRKENLTFEQFAVVKSNVILDHRCRRRVICFCPGLEEVIAGPKIKLFKWRKLATQGKLSVAKKWNSKFWSPKISLTPLKRESKAASYRHQLSFVLIRRGESWLCTRRVVLSSNMSTEQEVMRSLVGKCLERYLFNQFLWTWFSHSNVSKPLVTTCEILVASTRFLLAISDPDFQNVLTRFPTPCLKEIFDF